MAEKTSYLIRVKVRMEWPEGMSADEAVERAVNQQANYGGELDLADDHEAGGDNNKASVDLIVYFRRVAESDYQAVNAVQREQIFCLDATILEGPMVTAEEPYTDE